MGKVLAVALRAPGTAAPTPVDGAHALGGLGLEGDRHLDARSPRQVLLASKEVYEELGLAPSSLRENLLLDIATGDLPSGTLLRIGAEAVVRVSFQCEACGSLEWLRPGLVRAIGRRRGVLARVHAGGVIHRGDRVEVLDARAPALAEDWRARVLQVLDALPPGMVVDYAELARLAGIQSSYCRAFPRLLAKHGLAHKALPARSAGALPRWDGAGLYD